MEALTETTENTWQLNAADNPLNRIIEKALRFPQTITIKGRETAVVIPADVYQKLLPPRENLTGFLRGSLEDDDVLMRDASITERAIPFELPY
ncbi:MAG: type II toxin-antitoxin system Phd/YefM family antitoxin [Treponema sp.]|jgi:prevent-host-death family protein|nr:type II toxin-antitoxin system Phd/YefM family antitoxin [Treponema sp.]